MMTTRWTIPALTCFAVFLSAPAANAALEEMIVSSERREGNLQDVPIAVTALNQDKLQEFQVYQATDLQRYVPSLNMFNNVTSPTNLSPSLRGGLQQDASLVTAESPFGIYVDDIYVGRLNGNNVTLSDIERVEVLRGPQGTLYGRNTAYGAIRFISRTPDDELWFDAGLGIGNYDQVRVNASVGGPLGDSWAASLAGQYVTKDKQFFNVTTNEKLGLNENTSLRGKLRYKGSETFDAVLSVSYSDSTNDSNQMPKGVTPNVPGDFCGNDPVVGCQAGEVAQFRTSDIAWVNGEFNTATPVGAFPLPSVAGGGTAPTLVPPPLGTGPRGETTQTITGLTLSWDINNRLTFKSITGYVGLDDYFHTDFSGNTGNGDPVNNFQVFGFTGATDVSSDQFSQEFQLLGTVGDNINYIGGFYYLDEDADQNFGWNGYNIVFDGMGNLDPGFAPVSQSLLNTSNTSISFFGEGSITFWEQLTLIAGLRWTEDDKDFNAAFQSFLAFPLPPVLNIPLEGKYDEWTPRAVIEYAFNTGGVVDNFMVYGSAAKGFKGGGFSAIAIFSPGDFGVYGPETNWTYEGGLKSEWFGSSLRTNLALFLSDISGIQQNATGGTPAFPTFPVQNSGDAEIKGLEYEIQWNAWEGLNFFLTGSFMDGRYTTLDPGSAAGQAQHKYGVAAEPPQVPDYAFTVGFDYTFEMPGNFFSDTSLGMDYYKTDDYLTAATNDFRTDGWETINAFVAIDFADNWEARLTGKNLADDTIITSGSRSLGGFIFLAPREYLFQVNYRL